MEKINGRKLSLIFIFILILLVIALLVGKFTFSYLGPTISDDLETQGEVTASGDTLIFTKGNNLSLSASTDNFATGGSNLSTTTNPKVKLIASTKTNEASATYYVGVLIKTNSYIYTTSDKTPEVILTIKDENGNNVTSGVDGLTYVTSGSVSGFDVTGKTGLFNIKTDYPISTTSSSTGTTHTWTFTLTFVNLGTDQSDNENASMNLDIYLQKNNLKSTLANYVITQYTGTQGENGIYYHNEGIKDNSYRYAGSDYLLTKKAKNANYTKIISNNTNLDNGLINLYCGGVKNNNFSCGDEYYFVLQYDTNNIQYLTLNEALKQAVADGYLTDNNINNFVCFGTDQVPCPKNNLYRIIGVFAEENHGVLNQQLVKLIKYNFSTKEELGEDNFGEISYAKRYPSYTGTLAKVETYKWLDSNASLFAWSDSKLNNAFLSYLTYLNNNDLKWAKMIPVVSWKVAGITDNVRSGAPRIAIYNYEMKNLDPGDFSSTNEVTYNSKIGLMYVSDYILAFVNYMNAPSRIPYIYDGNNWLFSGFPEWTITRSSGIYSNSTDERYAYYIDDTGGVTNSEINQSQGLRVSFYLNSLAIYKSGSGSISDPIILN